MSELGGQKHDKGKLPWDLLPYEALEEVTKVLQFGASKYSARNWEQGISYSRLFAAALRHLTAWWRGQDQDPETGFSHLAHAACCVLFALTFVIREQHRVDDRPTTQENRE